MGGLRRPVVRRAGTSPRKGGARSVAGGRAWALALALPALGLLGVFFLYSALVIGTHAFTKWDGITPAEYIGLDNFAKLLRDPNFWTALRNNMLFAAFVPVQVLLSFVVAILIYERPPGWRIARTIFFLPVIMSPVIIGIVWLSILGKNGALNQALGQVGLSGVQNIWLGSPETAIPAIMIVVLWASFGFNMIIFLAGLSTLPPSLIDAAHVDGANWGQTLLRIIIPLMRRSFEVVFVLNLITSFAYMFPYILVLTNGGPGRETYVVEYLIYDVGFTFGQLGYGSAISLVLFLVVALLMVAYIRTLGRSSS
jgi:multiple sugar transport system permease protein